MHGHIPKAHARACTQSHLKLLVGDHTPTTDPQRGTCGPSLLHRLRSECSGISQLLYSSVRGLVSVNLPEGLTSIGNFAFWDCFSLSMVCVPLGCSVGDNAFLLESGAQAPWTRGCGPPSPPPPQVQDGAIIEMTGDDPKFIFGTLEDPTCQLSVDRAPTPASSAHAPSRTRAAASRRRSTARASMRRLSRSIRPCSLRCPSCAV